SVIPDGRRLDIVIEKESEVGRSPHRNRVAMLDPDGLSGSVPPAPGKTGPDANGVDWRLKGLFRAMCLIEVLVAREDWLLGVQGCALMQRTLADLYAAANGATSPNGVKHYSSRLTSAQKAVLEALPPIAATREAVIAGHCAILDAVASTVPALTDHLAVTWPSSLEQTARTQLAEARRRTPWRGAPRPSDADIQRHER
ncbi:MAG TPA: hypothetical protein VGR90_08115, partial [Acidimicrobiales bacterium]|nr:hypothetical protein [Acidimicrobiales bacterium]